MSRHMFMPRTLSSRSFDLFFRPRSRACRDWIYDIDEASNNNFKRRLIINILSFQLNLLKRQKHDFHAFSCSSQHTIFATFFVCPTVVVVVVVDNLTRVNASFREIKFIDSILDSLAKIFLPTPHTCSTLHIYRWFDEHDFSVKSRMSKCAQHVQHAYKFLALQDNKIWIFTFMLRCSMFRPISMLLLLLFCYLPTIKSM